MGKFWIDNFLNKYKNIFDDSSNDWINVDYINLFIDAETKLNKTRRNYKDGHNKFFYFLYCGIILPISFITIIPAYWAYKKFKQLRNNKLSLEQEISKAENEKLLVHKKIIDTIDFKKIINEYSKIIKYTHCGPIPQKLIDLMQEVSLFNISCNETINPYTTSWGIVDENKIVLNIAKQCQNWFNKTYTGSVTVPYTYYNSSTKSTETRYETVTASFTHPAVNIFTEKESFTFMESCSNLEFKFDGESGKFRSSRYNKKNNYSELENKKFDDEFNWYRTDDTQFRMIFTPLAQENYLLDTDNGKTITQQLKWFKTKSYIGNGYRRKYYSFEPMEALFDSIYDFQVNWNQSIENFKQNIHMSLISYYEDLFNNTNYIWMTTLMQSEDHKTIINNIFNEKRKVKNNINLFGFNILNEVLSKRVVTADTDTFHEICGYDLLDNDNQILKCSFKGTSYNKVNKVVTIPKYAPMAGRTVYVDVHYVDFIPVSGNGYTYSIVLDANAANETYLSSNSSDNDSWKPKFDKLKSKYPSLVLRNGVASLYSDEENNEIINDLNTLI